MLRSLPRSGVASISSSPGPLPATSDLTCGPGRAFMEPAPDWEEGSCGSRSRSSPPTWTRASTGRRSASSPPTRPAEAPSWWSSRRRPHATSARRVSRSRRSPSSSTHVHNTVIAVGPDGDLLGAYRKLHLFDAFGYRESSTIRPGDGQTLLFQHAGFRFGVLTCYDLRFPELARELIDQGAGVLVVPAAWVQGPLKEDHWVTLARSRAIENTSYLIGSGQVGNVYCGRSLVIDPLGVVVAALGDLPGVAVAEIDPERIAEVRARVPSLQHRRFSVQLRRPPAAPPA